MCKRLESKSLTDGKPSKTTKETMTKAQQTHKTKKPKKNRLSKTEYKAYSLWVWEQYPICEICNSSPTDDVHHLEYGSNKDDSTILPVCRSCHMWCHANKKESQRLYLDKAKQIRRDYENSKY